MPLLAVDSYHMLGQSFHTDFARKCVSCRHPRDPRQNNSEKTLVGQHECRSRNRCSPGARLERMSSACPCLFHDSDGGCCVSHAGFPCVGDLVGIFPSSSDVPGMHVALVAVGRSSLLAQACEEGRVLTVHAPGRYGNSHHDLSCLCDQELGWAKKRPRRSGASAHEDRHEHFTRSNVAFLRVSC